MDCHNFTFTRHSIQQMFSRSISIDNVKNAVKSGEIIEEYKNDQPFPSNLMLYYSEDRPIHVVVAINKKERTCIIVTVYQPNNKVWNTDYKTRRK